MEAYYSPRRSLDVGKNSSKARGGSTYVEIPSDASIVRSMKLSLHVSEETQDRRMQLQEQTK